VHLIKHSSVFVPDNRQRRDFNVSELHKLANGIARNGLRHPISIESLTNPRLIAGERRLRVISKYVTVPYKFNGEFVTPDLIPVVCHGELSEIEREEVELEENILRTDISWQEKNDALARLHNLRTEQKRTTGEVQTYTATAREQRGVETITAADILAVRHATLLRPFLNDAEVKKAGTEREALSIVRRKLTQTFNEQLAKSFDASKGLNPHQPIHGDCTTVLPTLDPDQFDVIIVDPPYGIDAHKMAPMSQSQSGVQHEYEDTYENAFTIWTSIFEQGARVCKEKAHLYMFCDFRHFAGISALARRFSWDVWPTPIIWHKPGGGMLGDSTRGPRKSYELVLFAKRGDKRVTGVYLDVIIEPATEVNLHAATKPVNTYTNLLRRSCIPGDCVLDPCAGSGTIFPAANRLRLRATGIEISHTHYATALRRLEEQ